MITVFYDGKCGLCSKEINHYRKIAPTGVFDWQDVTVSTDRLDEIKVGLVDALKYLHVQDHNGRLHIGVDAFILIWSQLKNWRLLAKIFSLPVIKNIANFAYKSFANWRFKKLAHCQVAVEKSNDSL